MFENPRKSRQARNFTTNVPKILDLKSSSEQIFFRKLSLSAPVLSRHLLLTGHLGRSRSLPVNRGFSIKAQTSTTDSNDIILSQIMETSYLDISNTLHWKSGGCWQRLSSRTLEHSSKTDPCSKDTQRTQTKKINLVNDSFTSDKNLLY